MKSAATDSPWFWAYLFGTAALIALALVGPKYGPRQAQIEREYQGRQRAAQNLSGDEPTLALSSAEDTVIELRPLFVGLAAITIVAWLVFWRKHIGRQDSTQVAAPTVASAKPTAHGGAP
jgi:hypothetical protein